MIKSITLSLFIICFSGLYQIGISQTLDSVIYQYYFKEKGFHAGQMFLRISIYSDSTYKWVTYIAGIEENKDNFLNWKKSESNGIWTLIYRNTLVLKYGNEVMNFKQKKGKIKYTRFKRDPDGFGFQYKGSIFTKRIVFKIQSE
jgi:hypothetical protein